MLDSDIANSDAQLHVEFYVSQSEDNWNGKPFIRIGMPGDKTIIIEQPVREDHKERFPRQWLYFQMKQSEAEGSPAIGTTLEQWQKEAPEDVTKGQVEELKILKFQTADQVAMASDAQLQRVGMGGIGLRDKARAFLQRKTRSESANELEQTKSQLAELQAQMAEILSERKKPGRPRKEVSEA